MDATLTTTTAEPLTHGSGTPADTVPDSPCTAVQVAALPCLWVLPHLPESAGTARRIARHALSEWGVGEDAADQVLLVVSELVTNAVEHALPPVALRVDVPDEGMVHVEVADGGPAEQEGEWITSCAPDEHGRGSGIIDFLAASHGCCTRAGRSTHWADMPTAA